MLLPKAARLHLAQLWCNSNTEQHTTEKRNIPVGHGAAALHIHQAALVLDLAPVRHLVGLWEGEGEQHW